MIFLVELHRVGAKNVRPGSQCYSFHAVSFAAEVIDQRFILELARQVRSPIVEQFLEVCDQSLAMRGDHTHA